MTDKPRTYAVSRESYTTPTAITGESSHAAAALRFAVDDHAGWEGERYHETLWVRQTAPTVEAEPGQAIRVSVSREHDVEQAWHDDENP